MSTAHKGSRIVSTGRVQSAQDALLLAHYDITANDVLQGAPAVGIYTLVPDGKFGGGIAVEEGTTNITPIARQLFSGWNQYSGCVVTVTQDQLVREWNTNTATRIQTSGGGHALKYYISIKTSVSGTPYTAQCRIKNIGSKSVKFRTQIGNTETIAPNETKLAICTGTGNGTTSFQLRFEAPTLSDDLDFLVYQPQAEEKAYATSFTSTSRATGQLDYDFIANPDNVTISFWAKASNQVGFYFNLLCPDQSNRLYFRPDIGGSFTTLDFGKVLATNVTSKTVTVSDIRSWHMYTVTSNGTTMNFYQDGNLIGTHTTMPLLNISSAKLSFSTGPSSYNASAIIDELRVDNIVRTDEEIKEWYVSGAPFYPRGVYKIAY